MATDVGASPVVVDADGIRVRVRLTPRAARDAVGRFETLSDGSVVLTAHVRALPSDGEANAALESLLAKTLGVAKTKVEVVAGRTARVKTVRIRGTADALAAALARSAADPARAPVTDPSD